jgi:hypothetical protein
MRPVSRILALLVGVALCGGCAKEFVPVNIESNPTSAEVWLGGVQKDSTPCTLLFEDEGTFELYVKKPGYLTVKRLVTVFEATDVKGEPYLRVNPERMTVTLDPAEPAAPAPSDGGPATPGTTKPYYQ